jgi:hypothetical protein
MKKVLNFIKYNNLFTLVIMFVMLGTGVSLAASPAVRDGVISSKNTVRSIDNSYVIAVDLPHYNFNLKITGITEDSNNYYIAYSYQTIDLVDYVWRDVSFNKNLTVSKTALGNNDLGLFVSAQLGQLVDSQLANLKKVKEIEIQKGLTRKVVSTQYAGLIGSMLSTKDKTFAGYVPVKPVLADVGNGSGVVPAVIEPESERSKSIPGAGVVEQPAQEDIAATVQRMVEEILNQREAEMAASSTDTGVGSSSGSSDVGTTTATTTPPVDSGNETQATSTPPSDAGDTQATSTPSDSGAINNPSDTDVVPPANEVPPVATPDTAEATSTVAQ